MKIAVHGKEFNRESAPFIAHIFEILGRYKVDLWYQPNLPDISKGLSSNQPFIHFTAGRNLAMFNFS